MSDDKKKMKLRALSIALIVLMLVSSSGAIFSPATPTQRAVMQPSPTSPVWVDYNTNGSSNKNDGVASLSFGAKSYKYLAYDPYEPQTQDLNFTIGLSANARQLYYREAWPYSGYVYGSSMHWTSEAPDFNQALEYDSGPTNITGDDDGKWFDLPFPFQYYGATYSQVWVCSNGFLSFEKPNSTSPNPEYIPSVHTPNALIAGFWRDLNPSRNANPELAIRYFRGYEQAPFSRMVFIVTWYGVIDDNTNTAQTFQIILRDNPQLNYDDEIYFQYEDITPDFTSTAIGVDDQTGCRGTSYSIDQLGARPCYLYMIGGDEVEGRSFYRTFDRMWVSLKKTPVDGSSSIYLSGTTAYNIQFDPNDVWDPSTVIEFGVDGLLLATGGLGALAKKCVVQPAIEFIDEQFKFGSMQLTYDVVQEIPSIPESNNFLSYLKDYMKGYAEGYAEATLNEYAKNFLYAGLEYFVTPKLEGMVGFADPDSSEATFDAYVAYKNVVGGALTTDTFLTCLMDWEFYDSPAHLAGDQLVVTAGKRLDITVTLEYVDPSTGVRNLISSSIPLALSDRIRPTVSQPADIRYVSGTTGHSINWVVSDDTPSAYSVYQWYYPLNMPPERECVQNGTWSSGTIPVSIDGLGVGDYTYVLVVYDTFNNWAESAVKVNVFADTSAPVFVDPPPDIGYQEGSTGHTITWVATDDSPSTFVISDEYGVHESGTWSSGESLTVTVDGLAIGNHIYTCVVNDMFGQSNSDQATVTVYDSVPPVFFATPTSLIIFEKGTIGNTMNWKAGDHNTPGTYAITYYLAGHPDWWDYWAPNPSGSWFNSTQIGIDVSSLSVGEWYFTCTVHDKYMNTATSTVLVKANLVPPIFTYAQPNFNIEIWKSFTLQWTATDVAPEHYEIYLDGSRVVYNVWTGAGITYATSLGSTGSHTYTITVYDKGGAHASRSAVATVFDDLTAPYFTSTPPSIFYPGNGLPFTLVWKAVDAKSHGGSYTISMGGSGAWTDNKPIIYSSSGIKTPGTYYCTCTVKDASGNQVTHTVKIVVQKTN